MRATSATSARLTRSIIKAQEWMSIRTIANTRLYDKTEGGLEDLPIQSKILEAPARRFGLCSL